MRLLPTLLVSLLPLLSSCTSAINGQQNSQTSPAFDWFEYAGSDAIYNTVAPSKNAYTNPVIKGFYPDPSIVRVGADYYLVNSSFGYFPGVPIFHSTDLVNWVQIGNVLERPSQLHIPSGMGVSRGIFAPTLRHHNGIFYMITTMVDGGGNFIVTAKNPAGPWSDLVWLPEVGGIDPDLFFDDNGKAYILNNDAPIGEQLYDGHRAIWIREFDLATLKTVGDAKLIVNGGVDITAKPVWIEGPHLFKNKGAYYLINAEGGTSVNHSQVVFKAQSPWGPYIPWENNPILTQRHLPSDRANPITSVGHVDLVQTQHGEWWAVFLGCRPYKDNYYNTGRETFLLPVDWSGEYPVILSGDAEVPYHHQRPKLAASQQPAIALSGNFIERDEFDSELKLYWRKVRTPTNNFTDLTSQKGKLVLTAKNTDLSDFGSPAFIARAQQHLTGSATTKLVYTPPHVGDKAGIAAYQNDEYFYALTVTKNNSGVAIQLEKQLGKNKEIVAQYPLQEKTLRNGLYLKIEFNNDKYYFSYSTNNTNWQSVGETQDGTILSTQSAGGFVGATLGIFAYTAH